VAKGKHNVEIMIPLTVTREEMDLGPRLAGRCHCPNQGNGQKEARCHIVTMIETPRAAMG